MSAITPAQKQALITAISDLVTRLQAGQLTEAQIEALVADYVTGIIANDTVASAGTSTTELASIRGAYLAAKKALEDELAGSPAGLQTLADIGQAVEEAQGDIADLTQQLAGLANAFKYQGTVVGGADDQNAFDLDTLTAKTAGDYYKVATGGWFVLGAGTPFFANANDGIVFNSNSGVDVIDNTNSVVFGTTDEIEVTGSADTGFTVALASAIKARIEALEANTAGEDAEVRARLDLGDVTAAPLADIITTSKAVAVALPLGTHVHIASPDELGLGAGADDEVTVFTSVIAPAEGQVVINQTATWSGKSATRSADTSVEVDGQPTVLAWTGWAVPMDEVEDLYDLLTQAFNDAAQP